jgi:mannose-1-phosphate guanylyltransferase/phosphomannomutase
MVPIVNQPVMEHILGLVKHHGITEVVATLAFMPQVIEDYFGAGDEWGIDITYAVEETPLGTAGSVRNAAGALDETFIVISGDALTDIDLSAIIDFHRSKGGLVTIALKRVPDPLEFGVVVTNDDGRIERFLEKPTWGQVLSDTINTGIYVIEPAALEYVPDGVPFDFSSELFPLLMAEGHALYGCVVDGYWCDVGSLESYVQAHRDVLDGKAMVFVPGSSAKNDVWVGSDADIDPGATIGSKVVIGANTKVRAGARVGDYTVIGDNCLIGADVSLESTIMWGDCFVGARSEVNGAVLCRRVDLRAGARVEPGVAIGDETMIGHGALVAADVQVYPYKRVDAGATVTSSLIWESRGARSLFGDDGIAGLVNIDVTPELALRVGQAFGSLLPSNCHVVVSRDSSRPGRMVKRAVVAGLNATGCHVRDLRVASPAVTRFTARDTRCQGGVHVCSSSSDPQSLELHFYDHEGIDLSPAMEKKVERLYFRQEFRRAFFDQIGEIIYPPRALEYYTAGLTEALSSTSEAVRGSKLVVDMGMSPASFILPGVVGRWGIDLIALRAFVDSERTNVPAEDRESRLVELARTVDTFQADFGVAIDATAERITLVTGSGRILDHDTALHAMVHLCCTGGAPGRAVAVPVTASSVVERIAARCGWGVVRVGTSRRALSAAAMTDDVGFAGSRRGGYVFPRFLAAYDAIASLGMLLRLLAATGESLDDVVGQLPAFFLVDRAVHCPFDRKGAVMRELSRVGQTRQVETTEGVRITDGESWALVLPHATEAIVSVYAEGPDGDSANAMLERYASMVEDAIAE